MFHTAITTVDGHLYVAGHNENGQLPLGDQAVMKTGTPTLVKELLNFHIIQVACGQNHTICLTSAHTTISFGLNDFGQLGHSEATMGTSIPTSAQHLDGLIGKEIVQVNDDVDT